MTHIEAQYRIPVERLAEDIETVKCPDCKGFGDVTTRLPGIIINGHVCPRCQGTGRIPPDPEMTVTILKNLKELNDAEAQ